MGCGMSIRGQRNGLTALKDFQDEEAVFVQEERTRWERTKDWVGRLEDVPEEDMSGSKVQLGTWLCREMDKVLDKGERLSKRQNGMDPNNKPTDEDNEPSARRAVVQEEMENLMTNQERLMSMLFRVDAIRYQGYVQQNTGRLRWREAVEGRNQMKRQGSTRGNARTIMFSVMKASRATLDGEKGKTELLQDKENSPDEWPRSEGSSSSEKRESESHHEVRAEEASEGGMRRQSDAASEGIKSEGGINRETQEAFVKLQLCMGARKNLRKEFNMMDSREEKTITMNEFLFACYAMGTGLNKREITLVFKFIDTRGQGELSFDEFMAAFDLKSKLVRRMSQMEDSSLQAIHQHSSMPGMVTVEAGQHGSKRRSFSMPTNSMLKLHLAEHDKGEERVGADDQPLERSATTASLDTSKKPFAAHALVENSVIRQSH